MRTLAALTLALLVAAGCTTRLVHETPEPVYADLVLPADDAEFARWLAGERADVARERERALGEYRRAEAVCWQRFAVNDCLRRARRARRVHLDVLRSQDLELNAHERDRRTTRRLQTLERKAAED